LIFEVFLLKQKIILLKIDFSRCIIKNTKYMEGMSLVAKYVSLAEETAEKLKYMILTEEVYKPGERLPNESNLSDMLEVSRTSIREAVKILIAGNILEIRRGVGTFVKDNPGMSSNLFDMIYLSDKKRDLKDSLNLRLILEPAMIKNTINLATADELEKIFFYEEECRNALINDESYFELDTKFHEALAMSSHNKIFEQLTPLLHQSISIINHSIKDEAIISAFSENALIYHKKIIDCIKNKDIVGAEIYTRIHVYNALKIMNML